MKFTKTTIIAYLLYIVGIAVYVSAFSTLQDIHGRFFVEYSVREAIRIFCIYWIPLHWLVMFYSGSQGVEEQPKATGLGIIVYTLSVVTLYAFAWFFVLPANYVRQNNLRYTSVYLDRLYEEAQSSLEEQRYEDAAALAFRMQNIVKNDSDIEALLASAQNNVASLPDRTASDAAETVDRKGIAMRYVEEAQNYITAEDFASAYYYAQLALRETNPPLPLALELSDTALRALESFESPLGDEMQRDFYQKKQEGLRRFLRGSSEPEQYIQAFFIFSDLRDDYPRDQDVLQYYNISRQALEESSFFTDDAEAARMAPGASDIVFLNKKQGTLRQFIVADRVSLLDGATYLFDIEVMTLDLAQGLREHFRAAYAKHSADYLNLRAVDAERNLQPITVFAGSDPPHFVPLSVALPDVVAASNPRWMQGENIISMWRLGKHMETVNLRAALRFKREIVMRFMRLIVLVGGSFFLVGMALRNTYVPDSALVAWLLSPLVFFVFSFFLNMFEYALSILNAYVLNGTRFLTTILIMSSVALALLIATLLYAVVAIQKQQRIDETQST